MKGGEGESENIKMRIEETGSPPHSNEEMNSSGQ
jgi:hypothetical protein